MKVRGQRCDNGEWVDLHSNMDRFERDSSTAPPLRCRVIYIPIWIDLKDMAILRFLLAKTNLHSNMDRFESYAVVSEWRFGQVFTFQYG